ncbi:ABC transporter substrate-binding protein [Psychrobacillus soli]|uniref:ABC transporter substrate-binding protein n=1 Tax=Psychrobacillus soli TaxID=1543965 RepID=A0A544T4C4_9BACI|nr:ABC transporter substrate-binding protein [Psychrobacillus soli]TQR12298.1 ABC transporter substrate-binding protein [Psychrobacillus soli]
MKKFTFVTFMFALILLLVACSSKEQEESTDTASSDSSNKETAEEVVAEEEVKVEGELQFYTSQPDTDATALVNKFNEIYPDVEVKIFRSGTEEVIGKLLAEKQAGSVQADVLLVADNVTFESLKEQGLLESYESPEYSNLPADFVDADFMYAGTKIMATVLAVNTNDVTDLPTSWNVLTEEVAKGNAIMPSPLYSGAAAYNLGVITRQADFGWEYYENLKANEVSVVQGNGAALKAVAGGEKSYAMVVDYLITRGKAEGSPVDLVYPAEGVPVVTEPIGLMKDAKNPDAAKAFIDFVVSEEGQKLAAEIGYTPIREGVAAPEGLKSISELKVISAPVSELIKTRDEDKLKFKEMFGE